MKNRIRRIQNCGYNPFEPHRQINLRLPLIVTAVLVLLLSPITSYWSPIPSNVPFQNAVPSVEGGMVGQRGDFIDDDFVESEKGLFWEGFVNGVPATVTVELPTIDSFVYKAWAHPIGHCHAHAWWSD